jgi:hypothetical protein
VALAEYDDVYWFPTGELARNIPARVFPEHSNEFATLYADASGTTELPNPLNTDNNGRLHFWVEAGFYWISIDQESIRVPIGTGEEGVTPQQVDAKIAAHNADTTAVHGIPDTASLETQAGAQAKADAVSAALAVHAADTTAVHGIADTSLLETQAGAQAKADAAEAAAEATASADATAKVNEARSDLGEQITAGDQAQAAALAAHAADTTNVHGIPDTSTIPTDAQFQQVQADLAAHVADTTAVHGIPDTSVLATDADVAAVAGTLADHVADTTGVHGIADTSQLLTSADLEQYATDAELAAHAADTTAVHGIADTAQLATQADLAGLATDADVAAVQGNLDTHAADTTAVHGIADTSVLVTDADLAGLATQAALDAHANATTDVHGITDTAALLTQADLDAYATDAELAAHAADTTAVHGIADTSLLETQAGAQTKADTARDAAIADAATKYLNRVTGGTVTGGIVVDGANLTVQRADDEGAYRLRTTGSALDFEVAPEVYISAWENPDFTGAQTTLQRWEPGGTHLVGRTMLGTNPFDAVFDFDTGAAQATFNGDLTVTGTLDGAALDAYATDAELAAHAADTTAVHGIADTSLLETQAGAQAKADAARDAAIADAATKYLALTGGTLTGTLQSTVATAATRALGVQVTGDTEPRLTLNGDGTVGWGSGAAATDVHVRRAAANLLQLDENLAVLGTSTLSGLLQLMRASGTAVALGVQVTGDTFDRWRMSASGVMEWGSGAVARDTFLEREAAGILTAQNTLLRVYRPTTAGNVFSARVTGDTASRWFVNADGAMWWGPGGASTTDAGLWRSASGQLTTGALLQTLRTNATDAARDHRISGDTQPRFYQLVNGQMYWGAGGSSALDTTLYRDQPGSLVTDTNLTVNGTLFANNLQASGIGQRLFARRTSNLTRTNTAVQTNDTQLLVTLAANAVYEMRGLIVWGGSAGGDITMDFAIPSGATGWWTTLQPGASVASDATTVRTMANTLDQARSYGWFDMGSPNGAMLKGLVVTGASGGTYAFQWAQGAADATGTTVYANSYLVLERVA